jgi:hypothetical protein
MAVIFHFRLSGMIIFLLIVFVSRGLEAPPKVYQFTPVLPGGINSGQKAQKGPQKKKLAERICGRILAEFYQEVAETGPQKIFKRSSLFLTMITTFNVHQDEIKSDF